MTKNTASDYHFDWADLAFASKKPLRDLKATFIAAPREMSVKRFTELVKTYLPQGNIVLGIAKEPYIAGFDNQPQFKTLELATVQSIIDKVNNSSVASNISVLAYYQRELPHILEKIPYQRVVLVNGSWHQTFHTTATYYTLVTHNIPYEHVSPFVDEAEAKEYAARFTDRPLRMNRRATQSAQEMMALAAQAATHSFDTAFQVGAVLSELTSPGQYRYITHACNTVVPYLTYAMHHGAAREVNFSPPNDQNYYDAVHAETELVLTCLKHKLDTAGTTLFINVLPCPSCARMLCETDITDVVYAIDHSDGYAVSLLQAAGKNVTRLVE